MERPEIIQILIESLHQPSESEQRVAYEFLRAIIVRRGEPLSHRARAALHLALYGTRRFSARMGGRVRTAGSSVRLVPRVSRDFVGSSFGAIAKGLRLSRISLLAVLIAGVNRCYRVRDAAVSGIRSIAAALRAVRTAAVDTGAGLLAVAAALIRGIFVGITAMYSALINTIKMTLALALFAFADVAGVAIHLFVRIGDTVRFFVLLTAFGIAGFQTAVLSGYTAARDGATAIYTGCRRSVLMVVSRTAARVTRAYFLVRMVYAEVKRQATRQVLPRGATPFIAAGLVCMVLFVFGINSYFVINDTNKKGIFIDLSRYEWGDEALASILIGEGYDIYLNEKITEKRIKELLESGQYY